MVLCIFTEILPDAAHDSRAVRLVVTMFFRLLPSCQSLPETLRSTRQVRRPQGEITIAS